jgi:ABC-2 type transport system permease protein
MRGILLVARRDFWAYINTTWGWFILAATLLLNGLFFNFMALGSAPKYSAEVLETFFQFTGGFALAAAVLITMRLFAEERQTGTMVLLESSPLSEMQVVLGKYVSAMLYITMFALFTLYMPALIFVNGKVAPEEIAVGTWASSISRNQLLAAVISTVVVLFFVICWMLARVVDPPFKALISYIAFFDRQFAGFQEGRINTESVVFFVSVTFAFLLMATRSLISRRWE